MRTRMRLGPSARRRLSVAMGATALAFGAIVLARAHGRAEQPTTSSGAETETASRANVSTPELEGFVALTQAAVLDNGTREVFAEVRLEGQSLDAQAAQRRPVALVVVLDASGSMLGEKIEQARGAVRALAARMGDEDQLAVVVYDDSARVQQSLAPLGQVRRSLGLRIDSIAAGGGTNIPAGLALGASMLTDAPGGYSQRLVLISDGRDGSGVHLPWVGREVAARANSGVTTSALGVGTDYDERWLTTVADAGRGNYEFLARGGELSAFLAQELEQAAVTVAERTVLDFALPQGWRIANVYGGSQEGTRLPLGNLFSGERRRVTVRFEVDPRGAESASQLGLALRYHTPSQREDRNLDLGRLSLRVVQSEAEVVASRDVSLHAEAVAQHVDITQAQAVEAWRRGDTGEAERLTRGNLRVLREWRAAAPAAAPALEDRMQAANEDLGNFQRLQADSNEGRAYGLRSNASRRARTVAY